MFDRLKRLKAKIQHKRKVSFNKSIRMIFIKDLYRYPEHVHKYVPDLLDICRRQNALFYDIKNKVFSKQAISKLITVRLMDYLDASLRCIIQSHYHSLFVLLRSQCETLYLLKYLDKHPEYIQKFMIGDTPRFDPIMDIIRDVNDVELKKFMTISLI